MKNVSSFAILGLAMCPAFLSAQQDPARDPHLSGRNLHGVEFGSADGRRLGLFFQESPARWREEDANGVTTFRFNESGRDDWSVYLYDPSRDIHVQLDVHTRKVMFRVGSSEPMRELYTIRNGISSNGRTAVSVHYKNGDGPVIGAFLKNNGSPGWAEYSFPGGERKFRFSEVGRDDWSVYLRDESRRINVHLDLHTRKVHYNVDGGPRQFLYTIDLSR